MRDERGEGRGRRGRGALKGDGVSEPSDLSKDAPVAAASNAPSARGFARFNGLLEEIESLLFQSTQGHHLIFENADIARVMREMPTEEFYTEDNMNKVHHLFTGLLDSRTLPEKRCYLESLSSPEFDLLVRAYFQLVEKTMLANYDQRH